MRRCARVSTEVEKRRCPPTNESPQVKIKMEFIDRERRELEMAV